MADPQFPKGRRQPVSLEQKPIIWQDFRRKLHENERNWTERGGGVPPFPPSPHPQPVDPPVGSSGDGFTLDTIELVIIIYLLVRKH